VSYFLDVEMNSMFVFSSWHYKVFLFIILSRASSGKWELVIEEPWQRTECPA